MYQINQINSIKPLKLSLYNVVFTQNVIVCLYSNNNLNAFKLVYHNPKIKNDFSKQPQMILKRSLNQDTRIAAFENPDQSVKSDRGFLKRGEFSEKINKVIEGREPEKYFLLVGEQETGKTALILNTMKKIKECDVVYIKAHLKIKIFKDRLGKALQYTYREDYFGQTFSKEAPERNNC
ncbi:16397_t:CDS:2 [Dentiscutata erythropus]|uniref:16397_t:CDS:1 n=1 Tax=Dentiscutata erythropus TaxID=1348616 RepID=A0A9N9CQU6_9GLOM|nr:16397_t:CDS:2 [Dentiscutata erythropus]